MSTKAKPFLTSNVIVGSPGLDLASLRSVAQTYPQEFVQRASALIEAGKIKWRDVRDLKSLWRATRDIEIPIHVDVHGERVRVMSSAFPVLSGNLTVAGINEAYAQVPTIGQELVEEFDSTKETTTIVGVLAEAQQNFERKEGEPYTLVGAGEERFDIGSNPKGLRMQITQEMIDRNDVENVVERVNYLGRVPAQQIEKTTLREVTDHDGSAAAGTKHTLVLNKTGVALYSNTANVPGTRAPSGTRVINNTLVDYTNLETARKRLATMKDDLGERRDLPSLTMLVPHALEATAETILHSILIPGEVNTENPWGPRGSRKTTLLSSPKLDDLSQTAWYLGDPKQQFKRKWGLRIEMVTASGNLIDYLRSRVAFEARVAWDCKVGAKDYGFFIQCLTASTAPKDA